MTDQALGQLPAHLFESLCFLRGFCSSALYELAHAIGSEFSEEDLEQQLIALSLRLRISAQPLLEDPLAARRNLIRLSRRARPWGRRKADQAFPVQ